MKQNLVLDFNHKIGIHCASTAMRDILEYYGLVLTEELCFGLGCGLSFVYWRSPGMFMLLQGRGNQLEKDICEFLGLPIDYIKTEHSEFGWQLTEKYLEQGIPVIVEVDMSYLDYLRERFCLVEGYMLGEHKVVVVGFDKFQEVVYLSDYAWKNFKAVSFNDLRKARNSKSKIAAPKNAIYAVYPFPRHRSLSIALKNAMRVTCHRMLYSWDPAIGVGAVRKFANEVTRWPRIMDESRLRTNAFISHMMLEKVGTGGGAFRRIYSRFLQQAADILHIRQLNSLAREYGDLAKLWTNIADLFAVSARSPESGIFSGEQTVRELLTEVALREEQVIRNLNKYVNE